MVKNTMGHQRGGMAMRGGRGNCDSTADWLDVEVQREAAYRSHVEVVILKGVVCGQPITDISNKA